MPRDRQQRATLKRVDNDQLQFNITNARRLIYERNYAVDSKTLAKFLNAESWVPTLVSTVMFCYLYSDLTPSHFFPQNAFSRLRPLGFNLFEMLVVDLMHEFELGVWKALFVHLLRILFSINAASLHELDHRYINVFLPLLHILIVI
jgi:hypothetical protein